MLLWAFGREEAMARTDLGRHRHRADAGSRDLRGIPHLKFDAKARIMNRDGRVTHVILVPGGQRRMKISCRPEATPWGD